MRKYGNRTIAIGPWLLTAGLVLAVGCTGVTPEQTATRHELMLKPSAVATKADPELAGTTLGTDNSYVVYLSASCAQVPAFMSGQLYSYISANAKWEASSAVGTADPIYWPLGGEQLDFLGLASTPTAYADLAPAWDAVTPANRVVISDWDTYAKQYDVMYAVANNQTAGTNAGVVDMTFRHTMAVVGFTAVSDIEDAVTLNMITINGLGYSGDLVIDNSHTEVTAVWSTLASADKVVPGTGGETADYAFAVPTSAAQCARHLLVPQQTARTVTLSYTMKDAVTALDYTLVLPRTVWKAGYKYVYAIRFSPTEITATPTVTAWDGSEVDIEFDDI